MRRRTRYSLLLMAALIVALAVALILRQKAPPEAARLLPESDAIVYVNVKPLRLATHFDRAVVKRSPDFQHFIDATGIVPERDLDEVALALHRMDDPNGPNGPVAYSEVLEGRFDGDRLRQYLASIATARENYAGHEIFTIPVDDPERGVRRQLRVAQLGYDTVAASNMPTAEQIHSMLDRHRAAASPFAGSSLLAARYSDVPLLSSAWAIGHIGLPFSDRGHISVLGLQLPLPEDTTFVASLRYVGSVHLRIEQIAATEAEAAEATRSLGALLTLFRSMEHIRPDVPGDVAMGRVIDSLKIEQHKDRAVLTGTIPVEMLQQIATPEPASQP
jgi:hypothetical protein